MTDIWFTSDTHFCHDNIIKYCNRPYKDSKEMNEALIHNWNSVVKPGDKVYHLGDVVMGQDHRRQFPDIISKLQGKKRLVVGNHDDVKWLSQGNWFQKVGLWRIFDDYNFICTHVPLHPGSLAGRLRNEGGWNVHGHIHDQPSPEGNYLCICVEQTDYRPVHLEEIVAMISKKQKEQNV